MLSEKQQEVLINRANKDVDLPLVDEDFEERMMEKVVHKVNPLLEPAMLAFMPEPFVRCIKIALSDGVDVDEKRAQIQEIMRREVGKPLSKELNERVDVGLVPERLEGKIFEAIANKFVDGFVEWTVGEIDERVNSSLEASRDD